MNITVYEYNALQNALKLLPSGEQLETMSEENQNAIRNANAVIMKIDEKRLSDNERIKKYVAKKRKKNKNYARGI